MKKITLILVFLGLLAFTSQAQAPLEKGGIQINAGLGMSSWGLPIYGGFDYGVGNNISIGGELSFRSKSESYGNSKWKTSYTSIAGIANYHFNEVLNIPSKFDFYAGLSLGYSIFNSKYDGPGGDYDYTGSGDSGLYLSGQVGGRYFFSDKVAVNLEFGGGNVFSSGKIGVTFLL